MLPFSVRFAVGSKIPGTIRIIVQTEPATGKVCGCAQEIIS